MQADADLQYDDSDDASAMMVQAVENKARKFKGVTVIDVLAKDGAHLGTTILIDNRFSGYTIMTYPFASQLGYDFQRVGPPGPPRGKFHCRGEKAREHEITD